MLSRRLKYPDEGNYNSHKDYVNKCDGCAQFLPSRLLSNLSINVVSRDRHAVVVQDGDQLGGIGT